MHSSEKNKRKSFHLKKQHPQCFSPIAEKALDGIVITRAGMIRYINPAFKEMFGFDDQLLGTAFSDLTEAEDCQQVSLYSEEKSHEPDKTLTIETVLIDHSGKPVPVELYFSLIEMDKMPVVLIYVINITRRKSAEYILKENEKRFSVLTENSSDVVALVSPEGTISFISPAGEKIWGIAPELLVADNIFKYVHHADYGLAMELLNTVLKKPDAICKKEIRFYNQDNSVVTIEAIAKNLLNNPSIGAILINARDISNRKKAEIEIKKAKELAEQATRLKSEFLANISHEIRTPMNAILGFAEILQDKISDPYTRKFALSISSSGKTLLSLINDILDLSKIEAGKLDIKLHPVNLAAIINEVYHLFSIKARDKGLSIVLEIAPTLPGYVLTDEVRIRQILFNLIGNAVKFTEKGYIIIRVNSEDMSEKSLQKVNLFFEIEDTGIGIGTEQISEIFKAFQQQEWQDEKKYGGTGLGLTITEKLVKMLNGSIDVDSTIGKGTTFSVKLPDVLIPENPDLQETSEEHWDETTVFEKNRILVADDNESNRVIIKEFLNNSGLDCIEARNGKEAIQLVKKFQPALILLDLRMPVMDGFDTMRYFKNHKVFSKIPVIIISASVMQGEKEIISLTGCNSFLKKPISKTQLLQEIKKYLPYQKGVPAQKEKMVKEGFIPEKGISRKITRVIPEIIHILNENFMEEWQNISETKIVSEIKDFGDEVRKLGQTYQIDFISDWGDQVSHLADNFDLESLSSRLEKFPSLIRHLETLENGNENSKKAKDGK